ncbi:MAG: hypothetical protein B7X35_00990 [Halothiobacillus sp. 14-56-357]|jgi:IS30 family transposase|uniref:hypothetical protein n=1 Tax=Halothiobacillus sp. 15-55-196 TaxID=1970382 RepID=UPI000BD8387E|nr:hypothetical protein [Halothiobacillus sp. 15-55-196]OZB36253.1 MAG: hypothetical protein B7X44_06685 [Halothiobacillus sp. 15-55-196]OZB57456.1 MAG: hypothetical protein B7X35_00990 [Halothiobacillus sp. 14-56-357]OZB79391.1 MAG: hypothetical protein B7X29_01035 [Halothiobacillus sp. 13-55-115]
MGKIYKQLSIEERALIQTQLAMGIKSATIAWQLNTRPRKSLGFKCPADLFTPDAFDSKQHHAALFALDELNHLSINNI